MLYSLQLTLNGPNMIIKPLQFHWNFKFKNHQIHNLSDFVYSINHRPTLEDFNPHFSTIERMNEQLIPPHYHSSILTITIAVALSCCVCCLLSAVEKTCQICTKILHGLAYFIGLIPGCIICMCRIYTLDITGPPPNPAP